MAWELRCDRDSHDLVVETPIEVKESYFAMPEAAQMRFFGSIKLDGFLYAAASLRGGCVQVVCIFGEEPSTWEARSMSVTEVIGWVAAALTLSAHSMRTMLPLRILNLGANIFFITFSFLAEIYPTFVLHALLLPLNLYRLRQILDLQRRLKKMSRSGDPIEVLGPLMRRESYRDHAILFSRGDTADKVYYIEEGNVSLPEIDVVLSNGEIFGEMAYFSDARQRTTSAVCQGTCKLLTIDEPTFLRLYYQSPLFGIYIVRLIATRLIEGSRRRPELYDNFAEAPATPASSVK